MTELTVEPRASEDHETGGAPEYDLAFVGGGASTSYVLIALLESLGTSPRTEPLRLVVLERAPDPFSGVPYGSRAARTALLITSLRDFLPQGERKRFGDWLAENKHWVFQEFLDAAGPSSARWIERHRDALDRDDFEDLFLPRYVFGTYLTERARTAIARAADARVATVEEIRDDVVAIDPASRGFRVSGRRHTVQARRVVLATGSSPIRPRLEGAPAGTSAVLVDSPFEGMGEARDRICRSLEQVRPDEPPPHVVLIGGNAGTMDMLYQITDLPVVGERRAVVTVLTPGGLLPERMERSGEGSFTAETLAGLAGAHGLRAVEIYEAALQDIECGRAAGHSVADTLAPISHGVMSLLPHLPEEELLEFAGHWGVELGRHQRRAGWEYWEVVDQLAEQGRLTTVAGRFSGLALNEGRGVRIVYERDGEARELDRPADVVINCGGPPALLVDADSTLVATLIDRGVVRPTRRGRGIQVQPSMEAAPGLYVMGPLLAGNLVDGAPVWHMEHCGRISVFGTTLGSRLAEVLGATAPAPAVGTAPSPI
jgi:uncharacterized NAD(P)/FAD-binding protein YdhS